MQQQQQQVDLEAHVHYLEGLLKQHHIPFEPLKPVEARVPVKGAVNFECNLEDKLTYDDVDRYKRQMLLPEIAFEGQVKLKNARVLVVGAGGIGGPAALYLAGAGVGTIGLIDGDRVELSNLHRQIIHTTQRLGWNKCQSAKNQINQFNPLINVVTHELNLTPENAESIISQYDVVMDATDNPKTRYLINDACVILKKPLVSGSSVGWEGQLSVYGYQDGPCYRCLFPDCPKGVKNCNEAGVFGPMPGSIGLLAVVEAAKIIMQQGKVMVGRMLIADGLRGSFRTVQLRGRQKNCIVCGQEPSLKDVREFDYAAFVATCGVTIPPSDKYENISWQAFNEKVKQQQEAVLIDCRPKEQHKILNFKQFKSIPWNDITDLTDEDLTNNISKEQSIYIMCRRGNQSRLMCDYLYEKGFRNLHNIIGGINQYARDYDPKMPLLE